MKVYNKNDSIKCLGKNVFSVMDNFFSLLPKEYGKCYYDNLESLSLIKTRELNNGLNTGLYDADDNIIYFTDNNTIGHELFHVASNNRIGKTMGIDEVGSESSALLEGITEYLFVKTYDIKNEYAYHFEVLVSDMLMSISNILKYYFIPNHQGFINSFSNSDTIKSLMDNLNYYHELSDYYLRIIYLDGVNAKINYKYEIELISSIEAVIDDLIAIGYENMDENNYNNYINKLYNLLNKDNIVGLFSKFYPDYMNYTNNKIKKRVI